MSRPESSIRVARPLARDVELSFADAFENAPHGMALAGEDGTLWYANRALYQMLGYDREELLNAHLSAITHPDDLLTEWEQRRRLARADIGRYELVQRYLRKNGESVWVRLSVSMTRRNASRVACFIVESEVVGPRRCVPDGFDGEWLKHIGNETLSAIHEIGNTLTPLMVNTELIVEHSTTEPIRDFAHEIVKAARRIAFTLRRLRRIDDSHAVAYIGEDRMLDLRMIQPRSDEAHPE